VAEHLLDDLDVGTGGDRERGGGVPQLVRVEAAGPTSRTAGSKVLRRKFLPRRTPPRGAMKTRSSGSLPVTSGSRSETRKRGSGTVRRACVFGAPQTSRPFTSVTDSATTRRRRTRSTLELGMAAQFLGAGILQDTIDQAVSALLAGCTRLTASPKLLLMQRRLGRPQLACVRSRLVQSMSRTVATLRKTALTVKADAEDDHDGVRSPWLLRAAPRRCGDIL
jgi:hypothetical protein